MSTLQSIWTWAATALLIFLWLPLLGIVRLFDRDPARYTTGRWFRRLGAAVTRVNPAWKIQVSGERISDPRRPYVVVCNHQSMGDIPIISRLPWEMKWVAKEELFHIPAIGWMMTMAGDVPVNRTDKSSGARAFVRAKEYLAMKCSVMFFPEGTRSPDGRVHAFTDGAFRLAIKAGVPILPLALDGAQNALPKHSWKFGETSYHIRLKVLPPVETAGLKASDTEALRERVRGRIMEQMAAWRGVPVAQVDATAPAQSVADEIQNSVNTSYPAG